jgi:hypothetical protein
MEPARWRIPSTEPAEMPLTPTIGEQCSLSYPLVIRLINRYIQCDARLLFNMGKLKCGLSACLESLTKRKTQRRDAKAQRKAGE